MTEKDKKISEEILQNLKDAGCDEDTIDGYIFCSLSGADEAQLKLLKKHRRCLLEKIHEGQKQIDCLDYLLVRLEKEKNGKQ